MSIDQKIVYAGLSRMTKDRVVIQSAFQYWNANLSAQAFDVIKVTTALIDYLGLSAKEKKVLMIALHASSNKSELELANVPAYISQGSSATVPSDADVPNNTEVTSNSPHHQVTTNFITFLADGVRRVNANDYQEIGEILEDEGLDGLDPAINQRVKKYGFSEKVLPANIKEEACKELTHQLYLLIIDVIGPVKTDIVVNQVIDKLLGTEAAGRFDPRTLL